MDEVSRDHWPALPSQVGLARTLAGDRFIGCFRTSQGKKKAKLFPFIVFRCPDHGIMVSALGNFRSATEPCVRCSYRIRGGDRAEANLRRTREMFPEDQITRDPNYPVGVRVSGTCSNCRHQYSGVQVKDLLRGQGPCRPCGLSKRWISEMERDRDSGGSAWCEPYLGYVTPLAEHDGFTKIGVGSLRRARVFGKPTHLVRGERLNVLYWERDCLRALTPITVDKARYGGGHTEIRNTSVALDLMVQCVAQRYGLLVQQQV